MKLEWQEMSQAVIDLIRNQLSRRTTREKAMIALATALAGTLGLWIILSEVSVSSRHRADTIKAKEKALAKVIELSQRYVTMKRELAAIEQGMDDLTDSSLFAELEGIATGALSREKITAMNPSARLVTGRLEQEAVDITLAGVTLRNLVALLHKIEKGPQPLSISRLRVRKRFNTPYLFDVQLTVSRLRQRVLEEQ